MRHGLRRQITQESASALDEMSEEEQCPASHLVPHFSSPSLGPIHTGAGCCLQKGQSVGVLARLGTPNKHVNYNGETQGRAQKSLLWSLAHEAGLQHLWN